ncbi:MAG: hypothetical protein IAI48_02860 [Candidatus Eremiobacteraeota bacterium]|nr:hypothetical protein [Candidatus Eremiobacteraeota bacterium]
MLHFSTLRRLVGASFLVFGAIVAAVGLFVAATNPAGAASIIRAVATAITCSSTGTSPCFNVTNTSSGVAVYGTSKSGTGLRGASTSNYGVKATSTSGDGVFGQTSSGTAAVEGTSAGTIGVYGLTTSQGIGVAGYSPDDGIGVYGISDEGPGVEGVSHTDGGFAGYFVGTGEGVVGRTTDTAVKSEPLILQNEAEDDVFWVDDEGDFDYSGMENGIARTRGEASATTFGVKTAAPTMEDTGTAQLVGGASAVRLDPAFAATIDNAPPYRVFLTPHGDSRGLYVASEAPASFVVRESQGGRSSLSFDYRIVAAPLGHTRDRTAMLTRAELEARMPGRLKHRSPASTSFGAAPALQLPHLSH